MNITVPVFEFLYSVPKVSLLLAGTPEVAIVGRSNSGKSSLINAICQKKIAKTSKTPGRTRHAVVYKSLFSHEAGAKAFNLIDLPGFGFAAMSKTEAQACEELIFSYLLESEELRLLLLLLDIRRMPDEREQAIVKIAKEQHVGVQLVLTKSDKLAVAKRKPAVAKIAQALDLKSTWVATHSMTDERSTAMLREIIFRKL